MKQEEISAIFEQIEEKHPLAPADVPKLSLYIDQILTLFATGSAQEQTLTKSMVNNYSKEKLLQPIKGKKYSREQTLQLLLICRLKNVLPIGEIKQITQALMAEEPGEECLEEILSQDDLQRSKVYDFMRAYWSKCSDSFSQELSQTEQVLLMLQLTQLSNLFQEASRILAERAFFAPEQE